MAFVKGVGMTKFDVDNKSTYENIYECIDEVLDSADLSMEEIGAVFISNSEAEGNGERQKHIAPMLSSMFQRKIPIITVPAGCCGGGTALWNAINFHKKNSMKNILVVGAEKLAANVSGKVTDEMLMGGERVYEQNEGVIFPAQNALVAQQYMLKHNVSLDDLAMVALKNHENAFLNPKARFYGKKVTLEMIKKSPIIASPLRLFDCSIPCNGAAAVVISTDKTDIEIIGSGLRTSNLSSFEREDMISWDSTINAAKAAYEDAKVSADDIDFAELHDAFTSVELMAYEDLGFANKGEGKDLIRDGSTKMNGSLPVNASGGLKAKGHPISATGISQIYEIVKQMRKESGKRQLDKTKIGLAHNVGGVGSTTSVHILKKLI